MAFFVTIFFLLFKTSPYMYWRNPNKKHYSPLEVNLWEQSSRFPQEWLPHPRRKSSSRGYNSNLHSLVYHHLWIITYPKGVSQTLAFAPRVKSALHVPMKLALNPPQHWERIPQRFKTDIREIVLYGNPLIPPKELVSTGWSVINRDECVHVCLNR